MRLFKVFGVLSSLLFGLAVPPLSANEGAFDTSAPGCATPCDGCSTYAADCCDKLFGLIAPTDVCFNDFISPMTNPVFFEDPRTLTEARFIFLNHQLPPALGSDSIRVMAVQLRAALTDRLSLIATKDGYIFSDSAVLNDGWADVALGLKYNLMKDYETQTIVSAGFTFELPVGSVQALQGNGDGEFNLFLSGGKQLGDCWHWISTGGIRLPTDRQAENQVAYWSNHIDRKIFRDDLYLFSEFNWYHWMSDGTAFGAVEGGDLMNLGSAGVAGNDIVTGALGLKYKPTAMTEVGVAWEAPLTDRRGVLDNRITADFIIRY